MKNQTTYSLLVRSEEKGRSVIETALYATCILSVLAAILQFISQPMSDPFAGFESPAQAAPIVSHHSVGTASETKS
jgi:hypothetical protein